MCTWEPRLLGTLTYFWTETNRQTLLQSTYNMYLVRDMRRELEQRLSPWFPDALLSQVLN